MTIRMTGILTLLKRHGRNFTVTEDFGGTYDPVTGEFTGGSSTPQTVRGYFYDSKENFVYNTQIQDGKRKLILLPRDVSGNPFLPQEGAKVSGQRDTVSITTVDEIMSGEQIIFYICKVQE